MWKLEPEIAEKCHKMCSEVSRYDTSQFFSPFSSCSVLIDPAIYSTECSSLAADSYRSHSVSLISGTFSPSHLLYIHLTHSLTSCTHSPFTNQKEDNTKGRVWMGSRSSYYWRRLSLLCLHHAEAKLEEWP